MNPYLLILVAAGAAVGYLIDGRRGAAIGAAVVAAKPVWVLLEYQSRQAEASRLSAERNALGVSPRPTRPPVGGGPIIGGMPWSASSSCVGTRFSGWMYCPQGTGATPIAEVLRQYRAQPASTRRQWLTRSSTEQEGAAAWWCLGRGAASVEASVPGCSVIV